jgi:hypothetical protein
MITLDSLSTIATTLDTSVSEAVEVSGGMIPRDLFCFFWPELCGPFWP